MESLYVEEAEQEELEALFAKRIVGGKGKYKGKLPFKCFNYKKVGHYATRCLEPVKKETNDSREKNNWKGSNKMWSKPKEKKRC